MDDYINVPRARPQTGAGARLIARRTGKPAPHSARGPAPSANPHRPPPRPHDADLASRAAARQDEETARMYKQLHVPQYADWPTAKLAAELARKMSEHVDAASLMIRSVGVAADGVQHKLSAATFVVICMKLGLIVTAEQARAILLARALPVDGSLTIGDALRAFKPQQAEVALLADRAAAQEARRPPVPTLAQALPARYTAQQLAHELVRKLCASSSADSKLLMDMASAVRQSSLSAGRGRADGLVDFSFLCSLFARYGMAVSAEQAAAIWAVYALPPACSIADFTDAFVHSNRNDVMHARHKQPPPLSPRQQHPPVLTPKQLRLQAAQQAAQDEAHAYAAAEHGRRAASAQPLSPRRAQADARRAHAHAHARQRREALELAHGSYAPPPLPSPGAHVMAGLRAAARAEPLDASQLVSPRRLVAAGASVQLNNALPPTYARELLQAYSRAMGVTPRSAAAAMPPPPPRAGAGAGARSPRAPPQPPQPPHPYSPRHAGVRA